jgi:hypothetical protein
MTCHHKQYIYFFDKQISSVHQEHNQQTAQTCYKTTQQIKSELLHFVF